MFHNTYYFMGIWIVVGTEMERKSILPVVEYSNHGVIPSTCSETGGLTTRNSRGIPCDTDLG